ncbi:MAG: hypothetical protein WEC14_06030 [Chloroflexota bacterium]
MELMASVPLGPWSFPINHVGRAGSVEVSLLSLSVVDSVVRVAGVARIIHRPDLRIDRLPELALQPHDGDPLLSVGSHLLPQAGAVWIEWLYARPAALPTAFVATLDIIHLSYRAGGSTGAERAGPYRFDFQIHGRSRSDDLGGSR